VSRLPSLVLPLGSAALLLVPGARPAEVTARVELSPAEVYLGSPARLRVELRVPPGHDVDGGALCRGLAKLAGDEAPAALRLVGGAEAGEPGSRGEDGRVLRAEVEITRFELGADRGRRAHVPWSGPEERGELELWLPAPTVISVPKQAGDAEGKLRDAKGTLEPPPRDLRWLGWLVLGGLLGAALLRRLGGASAPRPGPPPEPPFERAMRLLAQLEAEGDGGDPRGYHYRLSEVIREYLSLRFGLSGLSETTYELLEECRVAQLDPLLQKRIEALLTSMDVIKFGRDEPQGSASPLHVAQCRALVRETEPRPLPAPEGPEDRGESP